MTDLAIAVLKENATAAEGQMLALCVDPRDILNLIARVEKAEADGWLYLNPDTGVEISDQHPVESGECDDAENVRPATASELRILLTDAWGEIDQMKGMRDEISRLRSLLARAGEALSPFHLLAPGEALGWTDEDGWTDRAPKNERICDWFGPTDFRTARAIAHEIEEAIRHDR